MEVQQTADGGYIVGGYSLSGIGGTKSQANWDPNGNTFDYWVVKTDSLGNKEWDKTFGGTDDDYCYSLQQTPDGGYILGGTSRSGISGNKTQPSHGGGTDYWLVKIDSAGDMQWDKVLGGNGEEYFSSIKLTPDGGFIIGGNSGSQINGNKSQVTCAGAGDDDYWIVKTDSLGIKQWDKDFGGSDFEHAQLDGNIFLTMDGGFMFSATSFSPVSCDKTESNLASRQNWTVKMDSTGNLRWNKTTRFPNNIQWYERARAIQSKDGCYVLATYSDIPAGGEKTQTGWGGMDYWFAKYCDTTITFIPDLQSSTNNLQIFPNPSSGKIQITLPSSSPKESLRTNQKTNYTLEVLNTLGQKVFLRKESFGQSELQTLNSKLQTTLDVSFLPKGIYVLMVNSEEEIFINRFVKE